MNILQRANPRAYAFLFGTPKRKEPASEPFKADLPTAAALPTGRMDERSETWIFVRAHCQKRLTELRSDNDNPNLTEVKTAVIRGRISMLKEILDLPKPKPVMERIEESEDFGL